MKRTHFTIVAMAMCLNVMLLMGCSNPEQRDNEGAEPMTTNTPDPATAFPEIADEPADESEVFQPIYEFAISGHPQYAKAILMANDKEVDNALANLYDRDGNLVKYCDGYGSWNAQGFLATFEKDNIELGVMGMGAGPYFTEKGKEYTIKIVEE